MTSSVTEEKRYDIAIIGGGVLGASLYHWITSLREESVILIEKESDVAVHTSSRNTGVIHRPFYLDPSRKRVQARSAGISYSLWKELAHASGSPWLECGTIEVAKSEEDMKALERYSEWSLQNGLSSDDFSILTGEQVSGIEPEVKCDGAFYSKTDVSTEFGALTKALFMRSGNSKSLIASNAEVLAIEENSDGCLIKCIINGRTTGISAGLVMNAAGGSALRIAHGMGYAANYSVLFFRGEYWRVVPEYGGLISRNIYSVPRHTKYPFLDPHFISRANGLKEIGPNAVLVGGPEVYEGISPADGNILSSLMERPIRPKLNLVFNREFVSLVSSEWKSSFYKSEMARRVREFIPGIETGFLSSRGFSGVRGSLIDKSGFVPEAIVEFGKRSVHILNYNSPGATGAPAYAVHIVRMMMEKGYLGDLNFGKSKISGSWDFDKISDLMVSGASAA